MKGYMSLRAKKDYNLVFSKWCISSVCNYFWIYEGGVFLFYFENGQLILLECFFGEVIVFNIVSDVLDDLCNSIYYLDVVWEWWVEIVEIKD